MLPMKGSVLTNRKSSSTPSLSDVSESKSSVASTEQAASAENLTSTIKVVSCHFDKAPTCSNVPTTPLLIIILIFSLEPFQQYRCSWRCTV